MALAFGRPFRAALVLAFLVGGSATVPASDNEGADTVATGVKLTAKQQKRLDKWLAGRVAGKPVSCISQHRSSEYTAISDDMLLYKVGSTVYLNRPRGSCSGATQDALVTRSFGSRLCSGDIAQVTDLQIGMPRGSCALGDFTPYNKIALAD